MIDITEDLRNYRELKSVWDDYLFEGDPSILTDNNTEDKKRIIDPRVIQFVTLKQRLEKIALRSEAVTITDPTLHRVFADIRINVFDENLGDDGYVFSDDFFYDICYKYHPNDIVPRMQATKPLLLLNQVPPQVDSMIKETREAYCLGLPTACISLCRSTVERVILDIALRTGRAADTDELTDMGMCQRISLLIDRSVTHKSPLRQQINSFMEASSNVVHSNVEANMTLALEIYHEAIALIQALYGNYHKQFKH